jgi:cold shock CspA family protein
MTEEITHPSQLVGTNASLTQRAEGEVLGWRDFSGGYGFVKIPNEERSVFVHCSVIPQRPGKVRMLARGQKVIVRFKEVIKDGKPALRAVGIEFPAK